MSKNRKPDPALRKHLTKALPVAVAAAVEAGAFIRAKFGKFRRLATKPDMSLVTEVDRHSEKLVLRTLRSHFPDDQILGEETGLSRGKNANGFTWHVDPLDGTTNFVHGFPFFCVSIGLELEPSQLVLGVIYQPLSGDLYTAVQGGGAYRNRKRITVSKTAKLSDSLLSTGFSMRREKYLDHEIAAFAQINRRSHAVRRTGSAALDLVHVAAGQFDGFWERGLKTWDMVAGLTMIAEAGGHYSRMDGKTFNIGDDSVMASNGLIHKELVRASSF